MINLMPPEAKKQIRAARANSILFRYVILTPIIVAIVIAEMGVSYFILSINQNISKQTIEDNTTKAAQYSDVKKQAESFRSNLAIAKYILNNQAPYTKILTSIANQLPDGASANSIQIDPSTFSTTPSTLQIKVTSYQQAVDVKNRLQQAHVDDVLLFDDIKLSNTSLVNDEQTGAQYYQAVYIATFSKKVLP